MKNSNRTRTQNFRFFPISNFDERSVPCTHSTMTLAWHAAYLGIAANAEQTEPSLTQFNTVLLLVPLLLLLLLMLIFHI